MDFRCDRRRCRFGSPGESQLPWPRLCSFIAEAAGHEGRAEHPERPSLSPSPEARPGLGGGSRDRCEKGRRPFLGHSEPPCSKAGTGGVGKGTWCVTPWSQKTASTGTRKGFRRRSFEAGVARGGLKEARRGKAGGCSKGPRETS